MAHGLNKTFLLRSWLLAMCLVATAHLAGQGNRPLSANVFHSTSVEYRNPFWQSPCILLGNNVVLRACPGIDCEPIALLPIGTRLLPLERSKETFRLCGIESAWYKVEVNRQVGWVWGGMIAKFAFGSHTDPMVKFLAGPERLERVGKGWQITILVRAIKAGKQISQISVTFAGEASVLMNNEAALGLEDVSDILYITSEWWSEEQRHTGGSYIAWTGTAFARIVELPVSEPTPYSERKQLIFPSHMEGQPGRLILVSHVYREAESMDKIVLVSTREFYRWESNQMVPSGEPALVTSRILDKNHN